jgi:hypothetical protein
MNTIKEGKISSMEEKVLKNKFLLWHAIEDQGGVYDQWKMTG